MILAIIDFNIQCIELFLIQNFFYLVQNVNFAVRREVILVKFMFFSCSKQTKNSDVIVESTFLQKNVNKVKSGEKSKKSEKSRKVQKAKKSKKKIGKNEKNE